MTKYMLDVGSDGEPQKSLHRLPLEVGDMYGISQWAVALQIREPSKDPMACQPDSPDPSPLLCPLSPSISIRIWTPISCAILTIFLNLFLLIFLLQFSHL